MTTLLFSPYGMNYKNTCCTPDNTRTRRAYHGHPHHMNSYRNFNTPPANIIKNETGYELQLSLPGYTKEDISIQALNDSLTIEGKLNTQTSETEKFLHREFISGEFKRTFTIGEVLDINTVDASFANGILSVKIAFKPRPEAPKPNNIEVK